MITNIEKAIYFATKAHHNKMRKTDPNVPMIFHPICVGYILKENGCDEDVVVAGILHDIIEDTNYKYNDIYSLFGERVAQLVNSVSELDKNTSWEERKKQSINNFKKLPLESKLIVCADKINNLNFLYEEIKKQGDLVWGYFNRGKAKQKKYYKDALNSLKINSETNILFDKYELIFNKVFVGENYE
jgi:guanosine-3',5'-bis(diphosphate) 3'-pyrophosphohydrolase